jgi:hypothetical protein
MYMLTPSSGYKRLTGKGTSFWADRDWEQEHVIKTTILSYVIDNIFLSTVPIDRARTPNPLILKMQAEFTSEMWVSLLIFTQRTESRSESTSTRCQNFKQSFILIIGLK